MDFGRWLLALIYIVPIAGTLVAMGRKFRSLWTIGEGVRKRIPHDHLYRWFNPVKNWIEAKQKEYPLAQYLRFQKINELAGLTEYAFGHLRDFIIGTVMIISASGYLLLTTFAQKELAADNFMQLLYFGTFALLSIFTYRRHVSIGTKMTEFMRVNRYVHPQEFFEHYYKALSPLQIPIPTYATRVVDPTHVNYKKGNPPKIRLWPLIHGLYDTAIFARSAYKAYVKIGADYGRDVFDVMASLWGSRMMQLFESELKVTGIEKLSQLEGKVIYVFNHKSHLDFVFNFYALSKGIMKKGRHPRPRYMAAKDHFIDNKFVYQGLGVGMLIEANDMVFVDRKGKGKDSIVQAADFLVSKDIEICMFPQGTRAYGNLGPYNERRDAGFYTTVSKRSMMNPMGHLKKGAAFLALDTALALQNTETPVHMVFVGIDGTADLIPKQALKVQMESTIQFHVGEILTIHPSSVTGLEKPQDNQPQTEAHQHYTQYINELQIKINSGLVKTLKLHEKLLARFVEDIRNKKLVGSECILNIRRHLTTADHDDNILPYVIIDRIYALLPDAWDDYLKEMAIELTKGPTTPQMQNIMERVSIKLFGELEKKVVESKKQIRVGQA
jgi:1-acyl-sn-glycerol-3-phosphate acyltransferase